MKDISSFIHYYMIIKIQNILYNDLSSKVCNSVKLYTSNISDSTENWFKLSGDLYKKYEKYKN